MTFVHLHNHTQYSLLDGACRVDKMIELAKQYKMPAVAMTDHGNMFGAIDFYYAAKKEGIKPIIGIETYVIDGEFDDPENKKQTRHHLVLLAKNLVGYKNLIKISSIAFLDGFYYKPRISKSLLQKYSAGLICLSACIKGEIPTLLLNKKIKEAEKVVEFYKQTFPEGFYLEIQDHGLDEEKTITPLLIQLAKDTKTPLVLTNDCHYLYAKDADAHDVLLCIQTGKSLSDSNRMKYNTNQLFFKSEEEMKKLFPEIPEAYENTLKIADQIDLELDYNEFLLPEVEIPEGYSNMQEYLKFLCLESAKKKYSKITDEIKNRIEYELSVIHKMGFEGYFLVVKDLIDAARKMDIPVGPGRGSAAGSIVSYLLDITQIEPLKYNLFFERFLNPERIGMPDIDIDFCAEGRGKVIDYIVEKYGRTSVTQIVTFNLLGAKSVIKDVARVLDVSAVKANEITKLIPSTPKITLDQALKESKEFASIMKSNDIYASILTYSKVLEGLVRHIGIHAAGVVIGPGNLTNYVPLAVTSQKGSEPAVIVQYEGKWLDELKMLKMDILGLKTLTVIKRTVELVKQSKKTNIDIDNVDLEDKKTYEVLANGWTDGVFQFESAGMKKYLIDLKPNVFDDLIAMVALYRPGPMQFIETFINRKHGKEKVHFIHPLTENSLKETYGVTVYQEQVMQIAREMGGLSGAEADILRKAMGKKKKKLMSKLHEKFLKGATERKVKPHIIEKIWSDWQEFAKYAFNKSHATAYAYVAFQTAYLKTHFPIEFMAALLSLEDNASKIPYFIDECKKMGIKVEPPNINKSEKEFVVKENKILFGLKAIKNVGSAAICSILKERNENGEFKNIFKLCSRVDSMAVNKAVLESLIFSGAMDDLEGNRSQNFAAIENALEYGSSIQTEKKRGQMMLFDTFQKDAEEDEYLPKLPEIHEWSLNRKLTNEKKILGFYWSGHPLNQYESIIKLLANINTNDAEFHPEKIPANLSIAGVVSEAIKKTDKKGNPFAIIIFEDIYGKFEVTLFDKDYLNYFSKMEEGREFFIIGNKNSYSNGKENILRIIPKKILKFEELAKSLSGEIFFKLNEDNATPEFAKKLKDGFLKSPGNFGIHFSIESKKFKKPVDIHFKNMKIFPDKNMTSLLGENVENPKINLNFGY